MTFLSPALIALVVAAEPVPTAIVDCEAIDAMVGLAGQVTNALLEEGKTQGLSLLTPEDLQKKLGEKKYLELRKCGGKASCAAQFLTGTGAKRVVMSTLARDERNYLLKLWLVDLDSMAVLADVDRAILIAARRFQKDVQQAVPPLLRGEQEARGTLVVESNVRNTQVSVNGEFMGVAPVTLTKRPGKYEVKLERTKYLPITRLIAVEANQATRESFKMLLIPGTVPDEEDLPGLAKEGGAAKAGPRPLVVSPVTWGLAGVTVVGAGVGLAFGLVARSTDNTLQAGYDPATDTYTGTRAQALSARQSAQTATLALAVAGAGLVGTVVSFVLTSSIGDGVEVAPTAGPGGAGVVVGGRF